MCVRIQMMHQVHPWVQSLVPRSKIELLSSSRLGMHPRVSGGQGLVSRGASYGYAQGCILWKSPECILRSYPGVNAIV